MAAHLAWKNLLMRHNLGRERMKHHKKGFNAVKHPPHCCLKLSPWEKANGEEKESAKNDKIAFYSFSFVPFLALKPAVKLLSRKNNFSRAVKVPFPTHGRWTVLGEFERSKGETSKGILYPDRYKTRTSSAYLETGGACWDVCWLSVVDVDGRFAVAAWLLSCV